MFNLKNMCIAMYNGTESVYELRIFHKKKKNNSS